MYPLWKKKLPNCLQNLFIVTMCFPASPSTESCLTLLLQVTSEPPFKHYFTKERVHLQLRSLGAYVSFLRTSGFCHTDFLPCDKSVDFIRALGDKLVYSWISSPLKMDDITSVFTYNTNGSFHEKTQLCQAFFGTSQQSECDVYSTVDNTQTRNVHPMMIDLCLWSEHLSWAV